MNQENQRYIWLLALFNPFISMLIVARDYKSTYFKNIIWFFCVFCGLTFGIGKESQNSDVNRYLDELVMVYNSDIEVSAFVDYALNKGELDFVRSFLVIVIGQFTDNKSVLLGFYGLIFGFFYSRNLEMLIRELKHSSIFLNVLLLTIALIIPIWFINGFRFYAGCQVLIYGLFLWLFQRKKSAYFFLILSVLFHFSLIGVVFVFFIYRVVKIPIKVLLLLFVFSFVVSEIDITMFNAIFEKIATQSILERTYFYRNEDVVDSFRTKVVTVNWYVVYYVKLFFWFIAYAVISASLKAKNLLENRPLYLDGLRFVLLLGMVSNIMSSLPSGGRFRVVFLVIAASWILITMSNTFYEKQGIGKLKYGLPILIFFIIVSIRVSLYSTSIITVLGNPMILPFSSGSLVSINDLIK
ncbi:MAG: hypothetical protein ACJAWO_001263 [Halieaceae bacterium]|jgi:hypothetical protein